MLIYIGHSLVDKSEDSTIRFNLERSFPLNQLNAKKLAALCITYIKTEVVQPDFSYTHNELVFCMTLNISLTKKIQNSLKGMMEYKIYLDPKIKLLTYRGEFLLVENEIKYVLNYLLDYKMCQIDLTDRFKSGDLNENIKMFISDYFIIINKFFSPNVLFLVREKIYF